jgi:hypothetical protein
LRSIAISLRFYTRGTTDSGRVARRESFLNTLVDPLLFSPPILVTLFVAV